MSFTPCHQSIGLQRPLHTPDSTSRITLKRVRLFVFNFRMIVGGRLSLPSPSDIDHALMSFSILVYRPWQEYPNPWCGRRLVKSRVTGMGNHLYLREKSPFSFLPPFSTFTSDGTKILFFRQNKKSRSKPLSTQCICLINKHKKFTKTTKGNKYKCEQLNSWSFTIPIVAHEILFLRA